MKELKWGEVAEGLVGADGVVGPFPGPGFLVQGGELERTKEDFIELLRMGSPPTSPKIYRAETNPEE